MKVIVRAVLLVLVSLSFSSQDGYSSQTSQQPQPTLQDTLHWLADATTKETNSAGNVHYVLQTTGTDGCAVRIEEHYQATKFNSPFTNTTSFSLADVDPNSISVKKSFSAAPDTVVFHTTNAEFKIAAGHHDYNSASFGFSPAFALKFAEALKTATQLCGGKVSLPGREKLADVVVEFDVPTSRSGVNETEWRYGNYTLYPKYHYHLCKEIDRTAVLNGSSYFERQSPEELSQFEGVLYTVATSADRIFYTTSTASLHVKVLEVADPQKAGCPLFKEEFGTYVTQESASRGWRSTRVYHAGRNTETIDDIVQVDVDAPDGTDDVYCANKFSIISTTGDTFYKLLEWTPKKMVMLIGVRGSGGGGPGTHIEAILFVKFLPRADVGKPDSGCTAVPPANWQTVNVATMTNRGTPNTVVQRVLPDGLRTWVYAPH